MCGREHTDARQEMLDETIAEMEDSKPRSKREQATGYEKGWASVLKDMERRLQDSHGKSIINHRIQNNEYRLPKTMNMNYLAGNRGPVGLCTCINSEG